MQSLLFQICKLRKSKNLSSKKTTLTISEKSQNSVRQRVSYYRLNDLRNESRICRGYYSGNVLKFPSNLIQNT